MGKAKHNSNKREMLYMATKSGSQKEITISVTDQEGKPAEVKYLLQHPGVKAGVQLRGRSKDMNGNLDEEKYYGEIMSKVIVQPRVNWEYWEENEGFQEVMKEASTFLMG